MVLRKVEIKRHDANHIIHRKYRCSISTSSTSSSVDSICNENYMFVMDIFHDKPILSFTVIIDLIEESSELSRKEIIDIVQEIFEEAVQIGDLFRQESTYTIFPNTFFSYRRR